MSEVPPSKPFRQQFLFLCAIVSLLGGCASPATFEGMVPISFDIAKQHNHTVRITVTGGQESVAVGRPQITNSAFARALAESIKKSRTFLKVIENPMEKVNYSLTVTLFSLDKLVFGRSVKLEAGWTLRRGADGSVVWQEALISQHSDANLQVATEGAAKTNIAMGIGRISKLNL